MTTQRWLPPLLALCGYAACSGGLFSITIERSAKSTVEAGTVLEDLLGDLGFSDFVSMDLTTAEELKNQGVEPGEIEEVQLTSFVLSAESPAGADLSFLSSMALYVEAPDLPSVRIAYADAFPAGQTSVAFELDDVDLTEYVVSESMTISSEVEAHRPSEDTVVKASFSVDVGVTAKGACNHRND